MLSHAGVFGAAGVSGGGGGGGDPVITLIATGTSAVATTTCNFGFTATAGRTLVLVVASDDYKTGDPSGWTLPTGGAQQTFLGLYAWYKVAAGGETSVQYTIGSAAPSCWWLCEIPNLVTSSPLDISNGQFNAVAGDSYATPAVIATTGRRYAFAVVGGTEGTSRDITGLTGWTNSYIDLGDAVTTVGTGTQDALGVAALAYNGDGSTSTSTTATFQYSSSGSAQSHASIIMVFKVAP